MNTQLHELQHRWFNECLDISFPDIGLSAPVTCSDLMTSEQINASFSSFAETPEIIGTLKKAHEVDRQINSNRYYVENPKLLLEELNIEMSKIATGPIKSEVLSQAFDVLFKIRKDNLKLVSVTHDELQATHQSEADAIDKALKILNDTAVELGISISNKL